MIPRVICFAGVLSLGGLFVQAQDIEIHSEFQRFNPWGQVVRQDHESNPREILSPAVPRNGHLTVQVVVTASQAANFFVYAAANPPEAVKLTLYRQHFSACGAEQCPDWLTEVPSPAFGALPESRTTLPNQTARSYVLDIYVPPDVPPRRVRVEALLKTGIWNVAPMEVRVIEPMVPSTARLPRAESLAEMTEPASATALRQFLRYANGLRPQLPVGTLRLRDLIQRNAAEDALLAAQMPVRPLELNLAQWTPLVYPQVGAEWYLRVRDAIFRLSR